MRACDHGWMTQPVQRDGTLAGYRLLRKLGSGSRADVYLVAGQKGTAALKTFAAHVERESVGVELTALGRVQSPHLVRLLDVSGMAEELPVLVLEHVRRGSLAALIRSREHLERGEIVTLLAPITRLVTQLQLAGVGHGKLGPSAVHLGEGGEPVLLGLGHARLFAEGLPPAALDEQPAASADRAALATLAGTLLSRVAGSADDPRTIEFARWIDTAPNAFELPAQLEERLFDWAQAAPIAFFSGQSVPEEVLEPVLEPVSVASLRPRADTPAWLTQEVIDDPVGEVKRRAAALFRSVRRRYWFAAAGILGALVIALALLPAGHHDSRPIPVAPASHPPAHLEPSAPALPDEPVAALAVLLAARDQCFRALSVLCLDTVDEASSAAFSSDAAAVQRVQQGGEARPASSGSALALVERLGDTALVSVGGTSNPASVLMIRTEAGWRIRDFLDGRPATTSSAAPIG